MTEILRLENLTRVFKQPNGAFGKPRQMKAVRDVSLSVNKGDVVGIVGESGWKIHPCSLDPAPCRTDVRSGVS